MLEAYQIEFYGFSKAVIGALIVGKVVVVLDKTKAGTRLDANHSLGAAALYKTMIYSAATFMALLAEEMFHAYRESGTLGEVFIDVMMHEDRHNIFARVLCIGLAFMGQLNPEDPIHPTIRAKDCTSQNIKKQRGRSSLFRDKTFRKAPKNLGGWLRKFA
ncbi:MAG: hypothetical protein P8X46_13620, partial [Nitrospirales bacterium]